MPSAADGIEHRPPGDSTDVELFVLPGTEPLDDAAEREVTPLERAARETIQALRRDGLLGPSHALHCQLLLDLARGYSMSVTAARGKVTVAASATAAQIQNLLESLPTKEGGDGDEANAWRELVEDIRAAGGGPALRYPTDARGTD